MSDTIKVQLKSSKLNLKTGGVTFVEGGGGGGGSTNLGYTASPTNGIVTSDTGTGATIPLVATNAGLMSPSDKTKLDGVATGATVNSSDATLLNRSNHTGEQAISTVTSLQAALDGKQASLVSGTTIKTLNSTSLLGSGNIETLSVPIITESTTARTLSSSDNGALIRYTNASGCTVTVPTALAVGFNAIHRQRGAGQVSFVGSGGMVIYQADSQTKTAKLYAGVTTIVGATNECVLDGYTGA